jgi:histidine triad (HIT) family protein
MSDCLFCQIVNGSIPAEIVGENDRALAFADINPQAPTHLLIVPKAHITNADEVSPEHATDVASMFALAQEVAAASLVRKSGYRLVMNVGEDAQNSVAHLHMHLLGGRKMTWPPG